MNMNQFVSAGPKNYAYKLDTGKTECTVKEITFNNITSLAIYFDTIKHIVCCDNDLTITVAQFKFMRNMRNWEVQQA